MAITAEELIRRVRAAKTPAQESAIIETELSAVRSSFKLRDQPYIARNVAKIVYASMRGHSVAWGDMGITNLCQSAKTHKEKRLAYLALQLVPHDNPTYLKMASNSIKTDMESGSQYRASIALCALAAVGTPEMLSELSASTLTLIKNKDSVYLRKKALIVALLTVKAAPEVCECFIEPCIAGVLDKAHSVSLAACQLACALIQQLEGAADAFGRSIQQIVKQLQDLTQYGGAGLENDLGGVNDPFLQIQLMRLIQQIMTKSTVLEAEFVRRQLSDVLEQIVSTQLKKGESVPARVAVQFEAARAILGLPANFYHDNEKRLQNLRAAAADALTEALDHKNQTVRYSALASITEIIHKTNETQGAQRHRQTVMGCMMEESVTLRRRALNLLVLITDQESAKSVVQQLLALVGKQEGDHWALLKDALNDDIRKEIISSAAFLAESFATDSRWHFDVLIASMQLIGAGKPNDDLVRQTTAHLAREKDIQQYAMEKLVALFVETLQAPGLLYNETLMAAAMYCIGECGQLIQEPSGVINSIIQIVEGPAQSTTLIRYAVSCVAKLYTKCAAAKEYAQQILQRLLQSADAEIQQRAYEYAVAINEPKAAGLLGAIPPPPRVQVQIVQSEYQRAQPAQPVQQVIPAPQQPISAPVQVPGPIQAAAPIQVMQPPKPGFASVIPGMAPPANPMAMGMMTRPAQPVQAPAPAPKPQVDLLDLAGPQSQPAPQKPASVNPLDDLLGGAPVQSQPVQQAAQPVAQQGSVRQLFIDQQVSVTMKARGAGTQAECQFMITGVGDQAVRVKAQYAAAQGVQIRVQAPSGDTVGPNKPPVMQSIQIAGGNLALRVKFSYVLPSGQAKEQLLTVSNVLE